MEKDAFASNSEALPPPYSGPTISQPMILTQNVSSTIVHGHNRTIEPYVQTVIREPGTGAQIITNAPLFGPNPATLYCGVLALMCCWPCVACIYCNKSCRSSNHYCSNCDAYQGTYQPQVKS